MHGGLLILMKTETIDAYVTQTRQVPTLGTCYGEAQILEVFKNTLSTKILFLIEDLRQKVEMAKRILTKEKTR